MTTYRPVAETFTDHLIPRPLFLVTCKTFRYVRSSQELKVEAIFIHLVWDLHIFISVASCWSGAVIDFYRVVPGNSNRNRNTAVCCIKSSYQTFRQVCFWAKVTTVVATRWKISNFRQAKTCIAGFQVVTQRLFTLPNFIQFSGFWWPVAQRASIFVKVDDSFSASNEDKMNWKAPPTTYRPLANRKSRLWTCDSWLQPMIRNYELARPKRDP